MSLLLLRFLKWIALFLLLSGTIGAFRGSTLRDRQWAAYWMATPGLIGVWLAGYLMAGQLMMSLGSSWISQAMLLSLLSFAVTIWSVERERKLQFIAAFVGIGALIASTGLMVWKVGGTRYKTIDVMEGQE